MGRTTTKKAPRKGKKTTPTRKNRKYAVTNKRIPKKKGEMSIITNTAKKGIWRRGGTKRIQNGALDSVDSEVVEYVKRIAFIAVRSCLLARRRRIVSKDIDFALQTMGEAIY